MPLHLAGLLRDRPVQTLSFILFKITNTYNIKDYIKGALGFPGSTVVKNTPAKKKPK